MENKVIDTSTTAGKIAVMQAFLDGKKIQTSAFTRDSWVDVTTPTWNWFGNEYRIKPEPKELWVVSWNSGITSLGHRVTFNSQSEATQLLAVILPAGATNCRITKFVEVEST